MKSYKFDLDCQNRTCTKTTGIAVTRLDDESPVIKVGNERILVDPSMIGDNDSIYDVSLVTLRSGQRKIVAEADEQSKSRLLVLLDIFIGHYSGNTGVGSHSNYPRPRVEVGYGSTGTILQGYDVRNRIERWISPKHGGACNWSEDLFYQILLAVDTRTGSSSSSLIMQKLDTTRGMLWWQKIITESEQIGFFRVDNQIVTCTLNSITPPHNPQNDVIEVL